MTHLKHRVMMVLRAVLGERISRFIFVYARRSMNYSSKLKRWVCLLVVSGSKRREWEEAREEAREEAKTQLKLKYFGPSSDIRRAELQARRLQRNISNAPMHRYGSFRPGRKDWEAKWDASPGRRVLMYAIRDYGSLYQWASAINRCTPFAARVVTFYPHEFGFELDLLMPHTSITERGDLQDLVSEATIIHEKHELSFLGANQTFDVGMFSKSGKPRIFTAYGGQFRKLRNDPTFRKFVLSYDERIALTPDLNDEWFAGALVPQAVDVEKVNYGWTDGSLLTHSPSSPERKGTAELLEAITGLDIQLDVITGVSYEESLRRKRKGNLFFDQAGREIERFLGINDVIGWYGNSAIEAAVFGIPTIAHLSEQALEGAERAGYSQIRTRCAIINTPIEVAGIRQTIGSYLIKSADQRRQISLNTRKWVEEFHSYQSVGLSLSRIYERLV